MSEIHLTLPNGSSLTLESGQSGLDAALKIGKGIARAALAYKLNGEEHDLSSPITTPGTFLVMTFQDPEGKNILRHSAAHVMAEAVTDVFPEAQMTIGPVVDERFYYDFHVPVPFTPEDLERIETRIEEIIREDRPFVREECAKSEVRERLGNQWNSFKEEVLAEIPEGEKVSIYRCGKFADLCRGPHVPSSGKIGFVKLLSIAGAYWRGDQQREQLQRIYGTAFPDQKELKNYLARIEEAKKRDHRKLGRELDLFMFHPVAPGSVFWLDKGKRIYDILRQAMSDLCRREGYQEVFTPLLFKKDLYETSGHWEHYKEDMFLAEEGEELYGLKPMNCPSHMLLYRDKRRSYRELPIRYHDQGVLHRNEAKGALGGLTRVRQFCQDDAHIFIRPDQLQDEITRLISMVKRVYAKFEMSTQVFLSTRPEKAMGAKEVWDVAEKALADAIRKNGLDFTVHEGDGAFYGPKIDFLVRDALEREHQTATIQLDYMMPQRFGLTYVDEDGQEKPPIVVHRAIFGSFERFIAILIEHYGGFFPLWLAPEQIRVLPISDKSAEYAREVLEILRGDGFRAELDESSEKINAKVRMAELAKIPYLPVVGEREAETRSVSLRAHGRKDLGVMSLDELRKRLREEAGQAGFS